MAPGTEDERDPEQVRMAIEGVRAVMPLVEQAAPEQAQPIRDALSQLQLAYVRIGGQAPAAPGASGPGSGAAPGSEPGQTPPSTPGAGPGQTPPAPPPADESEPPKPGEPGPAQRSGRLWVPGQ
jgi:hypothetical protein